MTTATSLCLSRQHQRKLRFREAAFECAIREIAFAHRPGKLVTQAGGSIDGCAIGVLGRSCIAAKGWLDRPLRSVIADLNRYSEAPITLTATEAANKRVSGNIKLNQITEWLRGLAPAFEVELVESDHGMVLVSRPMQPATPE